MLESRERCCNLPLLAKKPASIEAGFSLCVALRLRFRVLLDLSLGSGETGLKVNYLRSLCKHTVNNASNPVVCSCFQYSVLVFVTTKVIYLPEESKMALSLFSGNRDAIEMRI